MRVRQPVKWASGVYSTSWKQEDQRSALVVSKPGQVASLEEGTCVSSPSAGAVLKEEVRQTPALGLKQQGFQLLRREPETINQNFGFRVSGIVIFANQHFLYWVGTKPLKWNRSLGLLQNPREGGAGADWPTCDQCWDSRTQGKVRAPGGGSRPGPGPAARMSSERPPSSSCPVRWLTERKEREECPHQPLYLPAQHPQEYWWETRPDVFVRGGALLEYYHNLSFLSMLQAQPHHTRSESNVLAASRPTLGAAIRKINFSTWPFPEPWSGRDLITSMKSSRQPPKVVTEE